jgi:hypothetical protein
MFVEIVVPTEMHCSTKVKSVKTVLKISVSSILLSTVSDKAYENYYYEIDYKIGLTAWSIYYCYSLDCTDYVPMCTWSICNEAIVFTARSISEEFSSGDTRYKDNDETITSHGKERKDKEGDRDEG